MNVYYDIRTVYPGDNLITLAMVADNDEYFYAEFNDFDKEGMNEMMMANILPNLQFHEPKEGEQEYYIRHNHPFNGKNAHSLEMRGNWYEIRENFIIWLDQFKPETVQFVGDTVYFSAYALQHFMDDGMELPKHCNDYIADINQMMACSLLRRHLGIRKNGKTLSFAGAMEVAHGWDRREIYDLVNDNDLNVEEPHFLTEARIVRALYFTFSRMYFAPTTVVDMPTEDTVQEAKSNE